MLFRTIYGPELESIYKLIWNFNQDNVYPSKKEIYKKVLINIQDINSQSHQTVDDALSFLYSAWMITSIDKIKATNNPNLTPFRLLLLEKLIQIWKETIPEIHPLDHLYIHLLNDLYIEPDVMFIANFHQEANRLKAVKEAGGISEEKAQAWRRVMEYLGVGIRIQGGFLCIFNLELVQLIIMDWNEKQGILQDFLENHFTKYLPTIKKDGEIAKAGSIPLKKLEENGIIELAPLQDSPSHFYFGEQKIRSITRLVT